MLAVMKYILTNRIGCILPQLIAAGTVTRRAVESTWLTASNPKVRLAGGSATTMLSLPV